MVCKSFDFVFFFFSPVQQLKKQAWKKFGEEHPVCENLFLVFYSQIFVYMYLFEKLSDRNLWFYVCFAG